MEHKVINPSTDEVIARIHLSAPNEIESIIARARNAFDSGVWSNLSFDKRKNYILKIYQCILDKAGELARLETLNTGKPIKESTFMDVPSSAKTFEYFANNFEKYLTPETMGISQDTAQVEARLLRQPLGVAVLIVPWNYPLIIASWKMAQALAAGNCVVLKPSSRTPLTALELGKIAHEAGIPAGVVNVVVGKGDEVGRVLCSDKRVDMISFTGSNDVGKKIMEYASGNVKKMVMELGGKSASIILDDANAEAAVNGSLCSVFLNQGQMCTAMSRILVQDKIYDTFVKSFVEKTKQLKLGIGADFEAQIGPLISLEQRKKVLSFIQQAKHEGAKLAYGGKIPDDANLQKGYFLEPTVILDVKPSMSVFRDEVFGPVACILKFSSIDEAIRLANDSDFALAACIWSSDKHKAERLAEKLNAGTVWINTYGMFFNQLPYGGFKQSGFGKELGKEGFLEYTRLKNVITDQSSDGKPLVNYWYGV
ncbi:MAG: aldehyde dehydrogenase family protein [Candidatus Omnitrophica bacterium]|nr:aldehyde dehydrogenase family protein [Candidatus Omnitrophota bacterium]